DRLQEGRRAAALAGGRTGEASDLAVPPARRPPRREGPNPHRGRDVRPLGRDTARADHGRPAATRPPVPGGEAMRKLAFAILGLSGVRRGGFTTHPAGPMAKMMGEGAPPTRPAPGVTVTAAKDAPGGPVIQQAPPPPPPSLKVTPGEVNESNYQDAI